MRKGKGGMPSTGVCTGTGTTEIFEKGQGRQYKELVKIVAWDNRPQEPILEPLKLEVDVYIFPPKNYHTKPKQALISSGELRPTTKPDLDNLVKGIKDGCSKIIWHDDAQIVEMVVRKFYDMQPRAEVRIEAIA